VTTHIHEQNNVGNSRNPAAVFFPANPWLLSAPLRLTHLLAVPLLALKLKAWTIVGG